MTLMDPETPVETPETPATDVAELPEPPAPVAETERPALTAEQLAAELTRVRNEAANYRTKLRDAEAQLENAKTPEEFELAVNELRTTNAKLERDLLVNKVSSKYELPPELAARLQGEDEAAIEADAKILAALVRKNATPESLSGGLTPGESDDEFDPVAAAHAAKARRGF